MARVTIARSTVTLSGLELATADANSADGMQFQNNGNQILFVDNGSGSSIDVTIDMAADQYGREGSKVVAVPAGEQRFIGPFPPTPFSQNGYVTVDFSASEDVEVAVLSLQS